MGRYRFDPFVAHVAAWLAERGRALQPDPVQAQRFLAALDPDAAGFSFRTFSETAYTRLPGRDPLERAIHGPLAACWEELVALNRAGACITVTINATNGHGRAPRDILRVRALFVDDDHPWRRGDRVLPPATIRVISSPGRFHHYWRVNGIGLGDFSRLQCRLAERFATDHKVCALNQSMAVPGFWRRKSVREACMTRLGEVSDFSPWNPSEVAFHLGIRPH